MSNGRLLSLIVSVALLLLAGLARMTMAAPDPALVAWWVLRRAFRSLPLQW